MDEIKKIWKKLCRNTMPAQLLLHAFKFLDDETRNSRVYTDNFYMPLFYYLGSLYPRNFLLEIGFGLGLCGGSYVLGSDKTTHYLSLQKRPDSYYSPRLGIKNVRGVYNDSFHVHVGDFFDEEFQIFLKKKSWQVILWTDQHRYETYMDWLQCIWKHCEEAIFCIDQVHAHEPAMKAMKDFCKIKQIELIILPTRYGTGFFMIS